MDQTKLDELKEMLSDVFLKEIIKSLRSDQITVEESKTLAQEFLKTEPYTSLDEARAKIHAFVGENPGFSQLKTYIDSYKDEQNTMRVIGLMKKYIQDDNIDKALEVAKQQDT